MTENEKAFREKAYQLFLKEEGAQNQVIRNKKYKIPSGELVIADLIVKRNDGGTTLVEFIHSTEVKQDGFELVWLAYKLYMINKIHNGIDKVLVVKIDKNFKKCGEINQDLLYVINKTKKIKHLLYTIPKLISKMKQDLPKIPQDFGMKRGICCLIPKDCPFMNKCEPTITCTDSVFDIKEMNPGTKLNLYWKELYTFEQIPKKNLDDYQFIQVKAAMKQKALVKKEKLNGWISAMKKHKNLIILEIGTARPVVPQFENCRPFSEIPFQFSIHYQMIINSVSEKSYLANPEIDKDYVLNLGNELIQNVNILNDAPILVYNYSKTIKSLRSISNLHNHLNTSIELIIRRLINVGEVFQIPIYYHPKFKGSSEFNDILSVLMPSASFNYLKIKKRSTIENIYAKLIMHPSEFCKHEKELKEHFSKYTQGLIHIINFLKKQDG